MTPLLRSTASRLNLPGWLVVLAVIMLWQLIVDLDLLNLDYLPSPTEVLSAGGDLVLSGELAPAITHTISVALAASLIALVAGVLFGTVLALSPLSRRYSMASVDLLRSLPVLALMPVALLIWGPTGFTELIVAVYAALWPILINTVGAVSGIPRQLHEVSTTLKLGRAESLRKVIVPAAVPGILVGARLAVVSAFVVAIVAEMIINPAGIGWGMVSAQQALAQDRLFAYAVVSGILGFAVNAVLSLGVRLSLPGSPTATGANS